MREIDVVIVGGGPRALTILERLAFLGRRTPIPNKVTVHVIDPGRPGHGAHNTSQHQSLLTNTLASQVTIFAPKDSDDPMSEHTGPSFTEWARESGLRRVGNDFGYAAGNPVSDDDYLPRAFLGSYLADAFDKIVSAMPENISVRHHSSTVLDIEPDPDGCYHLRLSDGSNLPASFCFLTTGHCRSIPSPEDNARREFAQDHSRRNPKLAYVANPYPLACLDRIDRGCVVAIQGLGLTAYDVIATLTFGRGGKFEGEGLTRTYIPSGNEPKIRLFSRNSLPYAARGVNQKGIAGRHVARFFTREAVEELRRQHHVAGLSPQLDFQKEVMPLLELEMAYAYRCAATGKMVEPEEFLAVTSDLEVIRGILEPPFARQADDHVGFVDAIKEHIAADLMAAYEGNLRSPIKAATDVIRDARDAIAAAVEFSGLTPSSHRFFCEQFVPVMNRVAFGPPRHRNAELLSLIDAGIVDWAGGPGAVVGLDVDSAKYVITTQYSGGSARTEADVLVVARLPSYRPTEDASALTANLLRRGLIREYRNGHYHPYGLDIDTNQHPIAATGEPWRTIWAIGYPVEGARFYTHALPRPFRRSTQVVDAERAVVELMELIDQMAKTEKQGVDRVYKLRSVA